MNSLNPLHTTKRVLRQFLSDDCGMIVSAELMIIMTVGVIALVTGVSTVTSALNFEYADIANALTGLNQSYNVSGHFVSRGGGGYCTTGTAGGAHAFNRGMGFNDSREVFAAGGGGATVAGSSATSIGHNVQVSAVAVDHAVSAHNHVASGAFALVEESALLVEEVADVETATVVETEAQLEQRLSMLEAEAARIEQSHHPTLELGSAACPLDELRDIEARIRKLRRKLDAQGLFNCDQDQVDSSR
jgi:Flp pilus assembly pilin Flp